MKTPKRREGLRLAIHIPLGLVTVLSWLVHPSLAYMLFLGFFLYEAMEDWRINDYSYIDIRGYLWGLTAGVVFLVLKLRVLENLF